MSVLLGDRKESKFEAITYSIELHDMLILLMQRGFGVKDVDSFVRKKYAYGEISEENFANVNNNGNTNYNNASNSNGVRPDSSINQRRRRCYPFRKDK